MFSFQLLKYIMNFKNFPVNRNRNAMDVFLYLSQSHLHPVMKLGVQKRKRTNEGQTIQEQKNWCFQNSFEILLSLLYPAVVTEAFCLFM